MTTLLGEANWSPDDIFSDPKGDVYRALTGRNAVSRKAPGGSKRPHGGTRSRFAGGASHHADRASAALRADHPAILEKRTLFPTTVVEPADSPRLLVSGHNNAKLGARVEVGPWAGFPIYQLTLEERATCPESCAVYRECMGNTMHLARRHAHGSDLIAHLGRELWVLAHEHPRGFAVRLHVLGDFYSVDYVEHWAKWMRAFNELHVWGYTARSPDDPIGSTVALTRTLFPDRWRIRHSVAPEAAKEPMQATTIWRQPEGMTVPEGHVCGQQFDKTATCGTCGLCWADAMQDKRIVFVGHGRNNSRAGQTRRNPAPVTEGS